MHTLATASSIQRQSTKNAHGVWLAISGRMRHFACALLALLLGVAVGCDDTETTSESQDHPGGRAGGGAGAGGIGGSGGAGGGSGGGDTGTCASGYTCAPGASNAKYFFARGVSGGCPAGTEPDTFSHCDGCACEPFGGTCGLTVGVFEDSACGGSPTVLEDTCGDVTDGDKYLSAFAFPECEEVSATVPSDPVSGCAIHDYTPCGSGGVCLPETPAADSCVVIETALGFDCPAPYVERNELFVSTGDCNCSCSGASGSCDPFTITISTDDDACGGTTQQVTLGDQLCEPVSAVASIDVPVIAGSATCSATSYIEGSLGATLCCIP